MRTFALLIACVFLWTAPVVTANARESAEAPLNPQASTNHVATLIFLGTKGGPTPSALRSETSVLLIVDGRKYLLDAGAGTLHRIIQTGHFADEISAIFITHNHLDHNAGLMSVMSTAWFDGNFGYGGVNWSSGRHVQIWGPADTRTVFDGVMHALSVSARIFSDGELGGGNLVPPTRVFSEHSITHNGEFYNDGTISVTAAKNTHYHFIPGSAAAKAGDTSYSYRFNTPEGAIVFTGDTGPTPALARLAMGAKVLVSEVVDLKGIKEESEGKLSPPALHNLMVHMHNEHLTPQYIGRLAQKDHVKVVILYHFVPAEGISHQRPIDVYLNTSEFTAGVKQYFDGTVIASRDLFEYDVYQAGH